VDCFFSRIRQAVILGLYANNVYIDRVTISLTCGSSDATKGAFTLTSGVTGAIISNPLIEAKYYVYAIYCDSALDCTFENICIWDAPDASYLGAIHFAGTSARNYASCGMNGSTQVFVVEDVGAANKNTIFNPHQQALIKHYLPIVIPNVTGAGIEFTGISTGSLAAARFKVSGQTDITIHRPSNTQLRFEGPDTTTTYRFIGQDIQVGAATNYAQLGSLGGTTQVYVRAEGSAADLTLNVRAKGTGRIQLNSGLELNHAPATSASAGANGALPATVQGYFTVYDNGGVARKVPFYPN